MTTLATHRTAFASACQGASIEFRDTWEGVEPPYAMLFWNGSNGDIFMDTQLTASLRAMLVVGRATDALALAEVDTLVVSMLGILRDLAGWRIDSVDGLTRSDVGPDRMYTVGFNVNVLIEV